MADPSELAARYPLEDRYRVELLSEADGIGEQQIVDFWTREAQMPAPEAHRRLPEVLCVAIDAEAGIVGISTVYLATQRQLRMDLWHFRAFVARAHRKGYLARWLQLRSRFHLEERYESSRDRRGAGVFIAVQNAGMRRDRLEAIWPATPFAFIHEDRRGAHHRVYFFPSAVAPSP